MVRLLFVVLAFLFGACAACAVPAAEDPPPREVPAAPMTSTRAPAQATFRTVGPTQVGLPAERLEGFGRHTFLKLALDEALVRSVYLGRVRPGAPFVGEVSLPVDVSTLHYELYDETGRRAQGVVEVRR